MSGEQFFRCHAHCVSYPKGGSCPACDAETARTGGVKGVLGHKPPGTKPPHPPAPPRKREPIRTIEIINPVEIPDEDKEQPHLERFERLIELQYEDHPTGCGGSFGELLCWEIHENGQTFVWLAHKWGISVTTLGDLIADHCRKLEPEPKVQHEEEMR